MDTTNTSNLTHTLSATEWKTVRNMSVIIRDDLDSAIFEFISYPSNTILGNVSNFAITRLATGFFDTTDFDSTSYNRGWLTFNYTPD